MASNTWTWSPEHNDYYIITGTDLNGQPVYSWAKQAQSSGATTVPTIPGIVTSHSDPPRTRPDSPQEYQQPLTSGVTPSVQANPDFISGQTVGELTTRLGLDQSYFVRWGTDARRFFVVGRVFAMLYTEPAGAQSNSHGNDDAYSYVRFQEVVYSQIRRFIVIKVRHGFVYACAISTYGRRGTNKPGCNPSEHTIAYFPNTNPIYCYIDGEYDNGMVKEPIQIEPADRSLQMHAGSRIRFSKTYPIEMNIKVKDVGRVSPHHLSNLLGYHAQYQQ